jgi:hypothetical protein
MATDVEVVHVSPGRIRLLYPSGKGDAQALEALASRIRAIPGVTGTRTRTVTGSVLVLHEANEQALLFGAMAAGVSPRPPTVPSLDSTLDRLREVERRIRSVRGFDELAFTAFVLAGVVQLARGQLLMPAATAFWYALSVARGQRDDT